MNLLQEYKMLQKTNKDIHISYDSKNDLYTIKYMNVSSDWNNYLYRIGRGLVLDKNGNIVLHPYDKFFNLGELQGSLGNGLLPYVKDLSKWDNNAKIVGLTEKIDGTLATFKNINDYTSIVATTGNTSPDTQVVAKIWKYINSNYEIANALMPRNMQSSDRSEYIFEYYNPKEPYAYDYGNKEKLFLHGIRLGKSRKLATYKELKDIYNIRFKDTDIELVKDYSKWDEANLLNHAETDTGIEGWVVHFDDGKMLKVKTKDYLNLRHTVALLFGGIKTVNKTRIIVDKYFEESIDDVYATLGLSIDNKRRESAKNYIDSIVKCINTYKKLVPTIIKKYNEIYNNPKDRREFFINGGMKESNEWFKNSLISMLLKKNHINIDSSCDNIVEYWWKNKVADKQKQVKIFMKEVDNFEKS